jgi:benzoyl-CoA reductase/2-hydroxyglutaryl-CoA dehydratase subunit BcrC/BadD/HgdB
MTYYTEFLKLCEFTDAELENQKQRIERAFDLLELGPNDLEKAEARVRDTFDIKLLGIRKMLGIWMKEAFDLVLAKEEGKTVIYYGFPPFQYIGMAIKAGVKSGDDVYVGCPEIILCNVLGQIFDKINPVLEVGEANGLPPGHALCSLLQIRVGLLEKGMVPIPDFSIATSYLCDTMPKVEEFMQRKYGYPVAYLDNCLDAPWGTYPEYDTETARYLGAHLNNLFAELKEKLGIDVNEETWAKARLVAGDGYNAIGRMNELLTAEPVPLGVVDAQWMFVLTTACTGAAMKEGPAAMHILNDELEERVKNGIGILPKGSPRVLVFFNSQSDASINRLVTKVGLQVPHRMLSMAAVTKTPEPIPFDTLGEKRAEAAMFNGIYHSTGGWIKRNVDALKDANVDGIIMSYPFSCRPIAMFSQIQKAEIEKATGLPVLMVEMDIYDNRNFSKEGILTRLEAFAEMLKAKKQSA